MSKQDDMIAAVNALRRAAAHVREQARAEDGDYAKGELNGIAAVVDQITNLVARYV